MKEYQCEICFGTGKCDWISYMRNDKQYFKDKKQLIKFINGGGNIFRDMRKNQIKLSKQLDNELDCPVCEGTGNMIELESKEDIINYITKKLYILIR